MKKKSSFGRELWVVLLCAIPLVVLAIRPAADNLSGQKGVTTKAVEKESTLRTGDDAILIEEGKVHRPF